MSVEEITGKQEFEQTIPHEVERKYIPLFPEQLDAYKKYSVPVEQYYLSHPSEPFSLRFRESVSGGELTYEATLKDTGVVGPNGLDRMEVNVPVSKELYELYKSPENPIIRKLRVEPYNGVIVDFYEDGRIQLESENEDSWQRFIEDYGDTFIEITSDAIGSSEWQAHVEYRRTHGGMEALLPKADLDSSEIIRDILAVRQPGKALVVHVGGRSGSGKSTIVRQLQEQLDSLQLTSCVVSTDDYHRGNSWLVEHNGGEPWEHWDDPIVYDTATMAQDLATLQSGTAIPNRQIDWSDVEPHYPGIIEPTDIIVVEGIYARSAEITHQGDLSYEMPTSLATCIGRRLLRDVKERPEFADPVKSLDYMLRETEPTYRRQLSAG